MNRNRMRQREIELGDRKRSHVLVDLVSPLGFRILWGRFHTRVFLWLADRAPTLAARWARL